MSCSHHARHQPIGRYTHILILSAKLDLDVAAKRDPSNSNSSLGSQPEKDCDTDEEVLDEDLDGCSSKFLLHSPVRFSSVSVIISNSEVPAQGGRDPGSRRRST